MWTRTIGLLCLVVACSMCSTTEPNKEDMPPGGGAAKATEKVTAIVVGAEELWAAYDANEVAADTQYKGKWLLVTGQLKSIDKNITDDVVLQLATKNEFLSVSATLADSEKSAAATLEKGVQITVVCIGDGYLLGPRLKKCRLGADVAAKSPAVSTRSDGSSGNSNGNHKQPPDEPSGKPLSVTANALWVAYDDNEVAADNLYKGKRLLVTGA